LIGISGHFMLNFWGHFELYAPVLVGQLALGMSLFAYFEHRKTQHFMVLVAMLMVNMKLHISGYVAVLPIAIIGLIHFVPSLDWETFTARKLWSYVLIPVGILGLIMYVFILEDFNDPRDMYADPNIKERLFLPIMGTDPPLDRYNLLSFHHIFDFLQSIWAGPGLAVLLGILVTIYSRIEINWQHPRTLLLSLHALLLCFLFFFINPLASMPLDWDLFSLFTIPLLLLLVSLMEELESEKLIRHLIGFIIGLAILNSSSILMHQSGQATAQRYMSLGKHIFKTYWVGSIRNIDFGFAYLYTGEPHEIILLERQAIIEELEAWVVWGKDPEYSELLKEQGKHLLRAMEKPIDAIPVLQKAQAAAPFHAPASLILLAAYFVAEHSPSALPEPETLTKNDTKTHASPSPTTIPCPLKIQA